MTSKIDLSHKHAPLSPEVIDHRYATRPQDLLDAAERVGERIGKSRWSDGGKHLLENIPAYPTFGPPSCAPEEVQNG